MRTQRTPGVARAGGTGSPVASRQSRNGKSTPARAPSDCQPQARGLTSSSRFAPVRGSRLNSTSTMPVKRMRASRRRGVALDGSGRRSSRRRLLARPKSIGYWRDAARGQRGDDLAVRAQRGVRELRVAVAGHELLDHQDLAGPPAGRPLGSAGGGSPGSSARHALSTVKRFAAALYAGLMTTGKAALDLVRAAARRPGTASTAGRVRAARRARGCSACRRRRAASPRRACVDAVALRQRVVGGARSARPPRRASGSGPSRAAARARRARAGSRHGSTPPRPARRAARRRSATSSRARARRCARRARGTPRRPRLRTTAQRPVAGAGDDRADAPCRAQAGADAGRAAPAAARRPRPGDVARRARGR